MNRLGRLLGELHRRSVWQILGSYAVGAWIILQLAETLAGLIGLPLWFGPAVVFLTLLGFPVLLVTSLVQGGRKGREADGRSETPFLQGLFTWRNATIGGVALVLLLGVGTVGYNGMRAAGIGPMGSLMAKGVLASEERLILASFEDRTPDGSLGETVTTLFRIDLAQSPSIVLLDQGQLASALSRMERDPSSPLTAEVATEVAVREGIKAVVTGEILPLGGGAVVSVRLVQASGGETLVALRETAAEVADIPNAVDRLSAQLRERIGESLRSIQGDHPLEQVTTPSLEALRKYAQAERANDMGEWQSSVTLLEEALAEDSTFAMGWRKLGVLFQNEGRDPERAKEALTQAFNGREHLTDRERYLAEAAYYSYVERDISKAEGAYEQVLEEYPSDRIALNNLAVLFGDQGRKDEAAETYLRSIRQGEAPAVTYTNAVAALFDLGRGEEAEATLREFRAAYPENPANLQFSAALESSRFEYRRAERFARDLMEEPGASWRMMGLMEMASFALVQGRPVEARGYLTQVFDLQDQTGARIIPQPRSVFEGMADAAIALYFEGDSAAAVSRLDRTVAVPPDEGVAPERLGHLETASLYAQAGRVDRARERLAAYEAEVPDSVRAQDNQRAGLLSAQAAIAQAEGRNEEALDLLREAREWIQECVLCVLPELGEAFEQASLPDSAVSTYEQYLDRQVFDRAEQDYIRLHRVLLGLGRSYEALGQADRAVDAYRRFVELWSDAEPALARRVEEIRERIRTLEEGSPVATFSIVGFDPQTGEMGVAVQSRVFSVGNGVIWGKAGVGVVATQAWVDVSYGPRGLELLEAGLSAAEVVDSLLAADPDPLGDRWPKAGRQFSVMDATGAVATHTGPQASEWAGHRIGEHASAQGNILAGPEVVDEMIRAFEETEGHLSFRLLAALEAGQAAGGDRRGMQSAAMLIVKEDGGVWLNNDVVLRLQVDDSAEPIAELRRLVEIAARQREGSGRR